MGGSPPVPAWEPSGHRRHRYGASVLQPLDPAAATELLVPVSVRRQDAPRINRLGRGHPLALRLAAATITERPHRDLKDAALPRVIQTLTRLYLNDLEGTTRRVVDAASVVRRATLSLPGAMLPDIAPQDAFDRLRGLAFVEVAHGGLLDRPLEPAQCWQTGRWRQCRPPHKEARQYQAHRQQMLSGAPRSAHFCEATSDVRSALQVHAGQQEQGIDASCTCGQGSPDPDGMVQLAAASEQPPEARDPVIGGVALPVLLAGAVTVALAGQNTAPEDTVRGADVGLPTVLAAVTVSAMLTSTQACCLLPHGAVARARCSSATAKSTTASGSIAWPCATAAAKAPASRREVSVCRA